jgi:hypothetical protein
VDQAKDRSALGPEVRGATALRLEHRTTYVIERRASLQVLFRDYGDRWETSPPGWRTYDRRPGSARRRRVPWRAPLIDALACADRRPQGERLSPSREAKRGSYEQQDLRMWGIRLPLGVQYSQCENLPLGGFPGGEVFSDSAQQWISACP